MLKKPTILYVAPFLVYILLPVALSLMFNQYVTYAAKTVCMCVLLLALIPRYKLNKESVSALAVPIGIVVVAIWILIDPYYTHLGTSEYNPLLTQPAFHLVIKFLGMVFVAPIIEELFVRSFLNRMLIDSDWMKVPHGKFTILSFTITTLFFGFAHYRWLAGLITGALFNLTYHKTKNIESPIIAHAVTNLILFIYVALTSSWTLW